MFCTEVSQLLVTSLCFSQFLSCSLLFSGGVICWALALLLTPSHLLCTCSFVSAVVCLDFSPGCSCKETASCRIVLKQPKRGRHVTSPETQWSCCSPRCPHQLPLPCHSRWLPLFFGSLHYYLPSWALEEVGSPLWPHQAAGGVGVSGRRSRTLKTPWKWHWDSCPSHAAVSASVLVTVHITSLPAQPRLFSRAQPLAPPAGSAMSLAPKLSWPIHVQWQY